MAGLLGVHKHTVVTARMKRIVGDLRVVRL
jgi:hypothetical protein